MVRRGQQGQQQLRKARRAVAEKLESKQGGYKPPDRGDCGPPKQWEMPYDDANTIRLQFILWHRGGRLADFVVNVQILASQGWETVEYFDCCHGHCHLHSQDVGPPRTIMRLDVIDDVRRAFSQVEQEAHGRARIIRG